MIIFKFRKTGLYYCLIVLLAIMTVLATNQPILAAAAKVRQNSFGSPGDAVKALYDAVNNNNSKELKDILGPGSEEIISSGDPVADLAGRDRFIELYNEKNRVEQKGRGKAVLTLGKDDFPFPLPLVRKGHLWVFDAKAGSREILNRRIGRNELAVVDVLKDYLEAQREYVRKDHNGDGILEFARKLNSTPGTRDGLYWEVKEGEEPSPFGPLVAKADCNGYGGVFKEAPLEPFHGYLFKILMKQGKNADGGAFDYLANDKMVLGFALAAYPARYRVSGVMTFIVNQSGIIYQKDLGKNTDRIVTEMTSFNPDQSWKKVEL